MHCPACGQPDSRVIDSRESDGGHSIRRRRECVRCRWRFTTYERMEHVGLAVVKRDGRREDYDRTKLFNGVATACHRRPVPADAVSQLVNDVEAELFRRGVAEVPTALVGELVMERLRALDGIAYIRFASVYRQFSGLRQMQEEMEHLAAPDASHKPPLPTPPTE